MGLDILFTIGISSIVIATYQTFSEHKNRRKVEKSKFLFRGRDAIHRVRGNQWFRSYHSQIGTNWHKLNSLIVINICPYLWCN